MDSGKGRGKVLRKHGLWITVLDSNRYYLDRDSGWAIDCDWTRTWGLSGAWVGWESYRGWARVLGKDRDQVVTSICA